MSQTTLASLQNARPAAVSEVSMSMDTVGGFENMQRAAKLFASSTIVPKSYQGNFSDCFIAVDMAMRMGANPLMVMQNLYTVHGNPAWSAQFLIATFNKSGKFSALRYEFQGKEGTDDWGCRACAVELATKEKLVGPLITIGMAKKEGWYGKPGSKWQSMPEQMLRYRAAAWFIRVYAPEIAMGLKTAEEERDAIIDITPETGVTLETIQEEAAPEPSKPAKKSAKAEPSPEPEKPAEAKPETASPEPEKPEKKGKLISCPKGLENGEERLVDGDECFYCESRKGCPAHEK